MQQPTTQALISSSGLFLAAAMLAACGTATTRGTGGTPADPHRHEFPLETRESVYQEQVFTGPDGRLIPSVIRAYVRAHFSTIFACYERARQKDPELNAKITVKWVIGEDGKPRDVVAEDTNLSKESVECILWLFRERLKYDPNRNGNLTIVYPILLTPAPPGPRSDPFFDTHDGQYGYNFAADNAARVAADPPAVDVPPLGPGGRLFSDAIKAVVHKNFAAITRCNDGDRNGGRKWTGSIPVKFLIGEDGNVKALFEEIPAGSDKAIAGCVFDVFRALKYPPSHGGNVNVMYTIQFGP
jgi:hypothetical protein